jgi:hypothetical protein
LRLLLVPRRVSTSTSWLGGAEGFDIIQGDLDRYLAGIRNKVREGGSS